MTAPPAQKAVMEGQGPTSLTDDAGNLTAPPRAVDPFTLFGLEPQAKLDTARLHAAWLELSRRAHPDRFQNRGGDALARAQEWSALLNRAYRDLKDPRARLGILLERGGTPFPKATGGGAGDGVPKELLAEAFELQEALEDVGASTPDAATRAKLEAQRAAIGARLAGLEQELENLLAQWDANAEQPAREKIGEQFAGLLAREKYDRRLLGSLDAVLAR